MYDDDEVEEPIEGSRGMLGASDGTVVACAVPAEGCYYVPEWAHWNLFGHTNEPTRYLQMLFDDTNEGQTK